jgi:hypothetical protein
LKKLEGVKLMQKVRRGIKDLLEFKSDNNYKDFQTQTFDERVNKLEAKKGVLEIKVSPRPIAQ